MSAAFLLVEGSLEQEGSPEEEGSPEVVVAEAGKKDLVQVPWVRTGNEISLICSK